MDFDIKIIRIFLSEQTAIIIESNEFLKNYFLKIFSIRRVRWDGQETTVGRQSFLVNHLIAVAMIAKIMNLPEKYVFGALFHDICEMPFGDISVGSKNELAQTLEGLGYKKVLAELYKGLQDDKGAQIMISLFLNSIEDKRIEHLETKEVIKNILMAFLLEGNHVIQFLEKLETSLLYLRPNLTSFTKEVIFNSYPRNIKYSLQFLPLVLKNPEIANEIKLNCIKIQIAFIAELVDRFGDTFKITEELKSSFINLKETLNIIKSEGLKQDNFNKLMEFLGYREVEQIIPKPIPYAECKRIFMEIQRASDFAYNLGTVIYQGLHEREYTELKPGVFQVFNKQVSVAAETPLKREQCDLDRILWASIATQCAIKALVQSHLSR